MTCKATQDCQHFQWLNGRCVGYIGTISFYNNDNRKPEQRQLLFDTVHDRLSKVEKLVLDGPF